MAVQAMSSGAHDFLTKPVKMARLKQSLRGRALESLALRRELEYVRSRRGPRCSRLYFRARPCR